MLLRVFIEPNIQGRWITITTAALYLTLTNGRKQRRHGDRLPGPAPDTGAAVRRLSRALPGWLPACRSRVSGSVARSWDAYRVQSLGLVLIEVRVALGHMPSGAAAEWGLF